ncbi:MAG: hypothetical protein E7226_00960 [Clostridiales bacterium]|nr:hypothetical protein [Clostridiales bacterium]
MKNMKKVLAILAAMMMLFAFTACGSGDSNGSGEDSGNKAETTTEPTVGTDVDGRPIDDQSFYGKWIADSSKAVNMFDGFEITFNEDGTYDAVVTGEEVSGTWTREGEKVTIVDEYEILPCNYTYTAKGGLKMYYEGEYVGFHR